MSVSAVSLLRCFTTCQARIPLRYFLMVTKAICQSGPFAFSTFDRPAQAMKLETLSSMTGVFLLKPPAVLFLNSMNFVMPDKYPPKVLGIQILAAACLPASVVAVWALPKWAIASEYSSKKEGADVVILQASYSCTIKGQRSEGIGITSLSLFTLLKSFPWDKQSALLSTKRTLTCFTRQ